ncbi:hypothetical protein Vretimale_10224, partial [Volvox reticuliferus]
PALDPGPHPTLSVWPRHPSPPSRNPFQVVVLSPDAAEPLLDLDSERHVYVIGGIVDRTHRKGLTLKFAEARQVKCRRLPIAEHAEQLGLGKGTRKCPVLNIDDVVKTLIIYQDTREFPRSATSISRLWL